jgi:hypothetical protein
MVVKIFEPSETAWYRTINVSRVYMLVLESRTLLDLRIWSLVHS